MIKTLSAALPIAARMLADRLNVPVKIGGKDAQTDGETVYLPDLPLESKKASVLAFGFLVHEVGHLRLTDFAAVPTSFPLNFFENILEDIRIELGIRKVYLGAKKMLSDLVETLVADNEITVPTYGSHPIDVIMSYMLLRLRCDVLGQSVLDSGARQTEEILRALLPSATCDKLTAMMFEVVNCQSTRDVVNLAERILAMLSEDSQRVSVQQKPPQQQGQEAGKPGQSSEMSGGEGQQDGEADESSEQENGAAGTSDERTGKPGNRTGRKASTKSEQQDQQPNGSGNKQPGTGVPENRNSTQEATGKEGEGGTTPTSPTGEADQAPPGTGSGITQGQAENLRSIVSAKQAGTTGDLSDVIANSLSKIGQANDDGSVNKVRMSESEVALSLLDASDILSQTRAATTALRHRMEQLMEAQRRCKRVYANSGRRVVADRIWKLKVGNTKVFERQFDGVDVNTAVLVLQDRSDSMKDQMALACQANLAIMMSLAHVEGVKAAAAAFPSPAGGENGRAQGGAGVTILTDFGERPTATASRYATLGSYGGTPMAEALLWSVYMLLAQKADRRILFVETDGKPKDEASTAKILKMAEKSGIEVIGLGIGIDISKLFRESRKIDDIDQMPRAVFEMLESKMVIPLAA